jgi:hypothetical protein
MKAKLSQPIGSKFLKKDVFIVSFPPGSGAWPGSVFEVDGVQYVLMSPIPKAEGATDDQFFCYAKHTAEEEWHIKRKVIARSRH